MSSDSEDEPEILIAAVDEDYLATFTAADVPKEAGEQTAWAATQFQALAASTTRAVISPRPPSLMTAASSAAVDVDSMLG